MTELSGDFFGKKYTILKKLGEGGFAHVYLAKDNSLGRQVAIKVLNSHLSANDPAFLKRFEREAQTVARLNHPNIIAVYESGQENGRFFMVMPYLPGPDLSALIKEQGPLPVDRALKIITQVSAALDYAHKQQVIHRDVKPANVMLNEHDDAVLTDFGIVKVTKETTTLTQTGARMGTLNYMAPEIWTTGQVNDRSDLYALGVMVYQMLTGQIPVSGDTPHRIMYSHLHETPPPAHEMNPDLPPAVGTVLLKMLAKSPGQRYQTAGEFCADLRAAFLDRTVVSVARPKPRKIPAVVWGSAGGAAALLLVGGLLFYLWGSTGGAGGGPVIGETKIELDGQTVSGDFQETACGKSHRLEIRLLDADRARIEPGLFAYNWRFEPDDPTNADSLNSASYARIYQVPCNLKNQTVLIEVQQTGKTLSSRSVNFIIGK